MEWTRSETLPLASVRCGLCNGIGLRIDRRNQNVPCTCVLRGIFRACLGKFRESVEKEKHLSQVSMEVWSKGSRRCTWGRKTEEYMADFCLIAKRTLDAQEHQMFRFHYLLGADWRLCCMRLKMPRGVFFHRLYRVQEKLGRAFRETQPYSLYPLEDYFGSTRHNVAATQPQPPQNQRGLVPFGFRVPRPA